LSDHHISDPVSTTEDLQIGIRLPKPPAGKNRRSIATVAAAAVAAASVGAGIWAWHAFADQGAQPAEALPGNTLAYAALDLDPPGGQKVEAFTTLRKFPSIKRALSLDSVDDVRKSVVDQIGSDSGCDLSYDRVKAWVGDRIAFAVVPQPKPVPVVVVQVADAAKARTELKAISADCRQDFGYVVGDQWAVFAPTAAIAEDVRTEAHRGTLSDDADFKRLTSAAGDPGLATVYAAPEAGKALLDAAEKDPYSAIPISEAVTAAFDPLFSATSTFGLFFLTTPGFAESEASAVDSGSSSGSAEYEPKIPPKYQARWDAIQRQFEHFDELTQAQQDQLFKDQEKLFTEMGPDVFGAPDDLGNAGPDEFPAPEDDFPAPELPAGLRTSLQHFTGLGGVARFNDGTLEVSIVGDAVQGTSQDLYAGSTGTDSLAGLPDDTAIAFGAGLSDGWVDAFVSQLQQQYYFTQKSKAETITAFKRATGLTLPDDLEGVGAKNVSIVIGSGFSPSTLFDDPAKAPVAVRIKGDHDKIEAALDKIRQRIGDGSTQLLSQRLGDDVVVGTNAVYLDHVSKGSGDLTGSSAFHRVVPDADGATAVYFVNFDAGNWLVESVPSASDRKDAEPVSAVGMSVTKDGDQEKIRYRVSFD